MDLLVLLLDLCPVEWGKRGAFPDSSSGSSSTTSSAASEEAQAGAGAGAPPPSFSRIFAQLLVFLNAFLLLSKQNKLAVIAAHPDTAAFLYPVVPSSLSSSPADSPLSEEAKDQAERIKRARTLPASEQSNADTSSLSLLLHAQVRSLLAAHPSPSSDAPPLLAGALSLALCHISRQKRHFPKLRPRVLVVSLSADSSSSYVPFMNCIFSAHKLALPIDALVLHSSDSLYLQQSASITSGLYSHPAVSSQHELLTLLLLTFLPDPLSRVHLVMGGAVDVDCRAVCFCHRRAVEQAMVCPVCLAVYCNPTPTCAMCRSKFLSQVVHRSAGGGKSKAAKQEEEDNTQHKKMINGKLEKKDDIKT